MSFSKVHVCISTDVSAGALSHCVLSPPFGPFPVPTPMISVEVPVPMYWPPGAVFQHELTSTVKHRGFAIALDGHNCGTLIPDVTTAFTANLFYAVSMPLSSREPAFAAGSVKMNGKPVACAQTWGVPLPLMTCGEPVSLPTAMVLTNGNNNLRVGMSWQDLLAGLGKIALGIALDVLFGKTGSSANAAADAAREVAKELAEEAGEYAVRQVGKEVLREGFKAAGEATAKSAITGVVDMVGGAIQGDLGFELKIAGIIPVRVDGSAPAAPDTRADAGAVPLPAVVGPPAACGPARGGLL
jgi:hypothetical protein